MLKKQRPEIQKAVLGKALAEGRLVTELEETLLEKIDNSSVACVDCGIGQVAEWLSQVENTVYAVDENRAYFSYRKALLPKSKVICVNQDPIKWMAANSVDYVIIPNGLLLSEALECANKSVFILENFDEHVINRKESESLSKSPPNKKGSGKNKDIDILPDSE